MLRSPYVIVGIGLAGCIALSWMAHSLQKQAKTTRPAAAPPAAGAAFAHLLVGPLASHEEHDGVGLRRVLTGRAAPGQDRRALARTIAEDVRRRAVSEGAPCAVVVTLRDADGADPCRVELAAPTAAAR